jgi:hypothetical protein
VKKLSLLGCQILNRHIIRDTNTRLFLLYRSTDVLYYNEKKGERKKERKNRLVCGTIESGQTRNVRNNGELKFVILTKNKTRTHPCGLLGTPPDPLKLRESEFNASPMFCQINKFFLANTQSIAQRSLIVQTTNTMMRRLSGTARRSTQYNLMPIK